MFLFRFSLGGYFMDRDSLTKIGWDENIIIANDEIAKEDHSYNATRGERSWNENSWRLVSNAECANEPLVLLREMTAKQQSRLATGCIRSMQQLQGAETQQCIHNNKSDKVPTSNSKGTKRIRIDLIHLGGGIDVPATVHSSLSSSLSWWQPSDRWWAAWNWESSSRSEQWFVSRSRWVFVACKKGNFPAIDGCVHSTPSVQTFFSCARLLSK